MELGPICSDQTCAESHFFKEKSSQVIQKSSHDLTFLKKTKKVYVKDGCIDDVGNK